MAEGGDHRTIDDAMLLLVAGESDAARAIAEAHLAEGDDPEAHRMAAWAAYLDDHLEDACAHFEAAYAGFRRAGAPCDAARCAIAAGELHLDSLGNRAVGNGWLNRARRLLESVGDCVEWGYLEVAQIACDRPDVLDLEASTERALEIAARFGDTDLEVRALADSGLALVSQGRLRDGFARLDEAMAAIVAGEVLDLTVVASSFCALVSSCERAGDVQRAEEWMGVIDARLFAPYAARPRILHTHCRLAYGALLSGAGRWDEAEVAILEALGPGASSSLGHRIDATARLAELRVRQGRVVEAAHLLAPYEHDLASALPLAMVHLARGEPEPAVDIARRARRQLVGDVVRGGRLLAVEVEAALAAGDLPAAQAAADALGELAAQAEGSVLAVEQALAAARVAARDQPDTAIAVLADALGREEATPLLAGAARLALAESLASTGDERTAAVEARAALSAFEQIGARPDADRAAALLRRLGAPARTRPYTDPAALDDLTAREAEVLALLREGLTNREIAERLYITPKTAEHHVGHILAKLGVRTRAEAAAVAAAAWAGTGTPDV